MIGIVVFVGYRSESRPINPVGCDCALTTKISDSPTMLKLFVEQRGHGCFTFLLFKDDIISRSSNAFIFLTFHIDHGLASCHQSLHLIRSLVGSWNRSAHLLRSSSEGGIKFSGGIQESTRDCRSISLLCDAGDLLKLSGLSTVGTGWADKLFLST